KGLYRINISNRAECRPVMANCQQLYSFLHLENCSNNVLIFCFVTRSEHALSSVKYVFFLKSIDRNPEIAFLFKNEQPWRALASTGDVRYSRRRAFSFVPPWIPRAWRLRLSITSRAAAR